MFIVHALRSSGVGALRLNWRFLYATFWVGFLVLGVGSGQVPGTVTPLKTARGLSES